jgi:hypothetical protein
VAAGLAATSVLLLLFCAAAVRLARPPLSAEDLIGKVNKQKTKTARRARQNVVRNNLCDCMMVSLKKLAALKMLINPVSSAIQRAP